MLGEQGNAASVDSLLKVAGREAGYWHATVSGEPQEPEFVPLCKTATEALRALAPKDLLQARGDLKACHVRGFGDDSAVVGGTAGLVGRMTNYLRDLYDSVRIHVV